MVFELVGEVPVGLSLRYMQLPACSLALLTDTHSTRSVYPRVFICRLLFAVWLAPLIGEALRHSRLLTPFYSAFEG